MIWLIIFIVSIVILIKIVKPEPTVLAVVFIFIAIISGAVFSIQSISGICVYPKLKGQLSGIKATQSRMQDIKDSYYKYKKDGNLVAGSVENLSQSTNLSKYINELAQKESDYNKKLQTSKAFKESFVLRHVGGGCFISNKIFTLPLIE